MCRMLFRFMRYGTTKSDRESTHFEEEEEEEKMFLRDFRRHIRFFKPLTALAQYTHIHYLMRSFRGAYLFSVVFNVYARFYSFPWIINLNHFVCVCLCRNFLPQIGPLSVRLWISRLLGIFPSETGRTNERSIYKYIHSLFVAVLCTFFFVIAMLLHFETWNMFLFSFECLPFARSLPLLGAFF